MPSSLGEKIRQLRMRKGWSLQQLADEAGVSKPHVYELEKNKVAHPSLTVLQKFAAIFDVPPAFFLDTDQNHQMNFQIMFRELERDFAQLLEEDQKTIEMMVQVLKDRRDRQEDDND